MKKLYLCPKNHNKVGANLVWVKTRRGKKVYKSRGCRTCRNAQALLHMRKLRKTRAENFRKDPALHLALHPDLLAFRDALAAIDLITKRLDAPAALVHDVARYVSEFVQLSEQARR